MSDPADPDEVIVLLEVSEDMSEYTLTVKSPKGDFIDAQEFIMQLESYLHEMTQAEINRPTDPSLLH